MPSIAPLDRFARLGCLRHVLLLGGLLALALGIVVARNWEAAVRLARDVGSMEEGADVAHSLQSPDDLRAWVREHEGASLVVWDLAADSAVVSIRGEARRPAMALPALLLVAELARQSAAGQLDTADVVPAAALQPLPGLEPPSADTTTPSLATLARGALGGHRAASDALLTTLGREAVDRAPGRMEADDLDAPLPLAGLFLSWAAAGPDSLDGFLRLGRDRQRDWAFHAAAAFSRDGADHLGRRGLGLTRDEQRRAARATFPRGTAVAYARLLARAARGDLIDSETADRVVDLVTRPASDSLRARGIERVGVVGGGFSGLIGTAGFTGGPEGGRVVVLLAEDVPHAVLYHLAQTGLDVGLVLDLLDGRDWVVRL